MNTKMMIAMASTLFAIHSIYANTRLTALTSVIDNAEVTLRALQQQLPQPIELKFISFLPEPAAKQSYYLYTQSRHDDTMYTIAIDVSADCHGAKYCNIGMLTAIRAGNPQIYYDLNDNEVTQISSLSKQQNAYYTPAHAMADYWPSILEWRSGNILYRLTWQANISKTKLIAIAKSLKTVT